MSPLVSIIIPVYNSANILRATVETALAQSHMRKEIIIIDDGSTDNSYELALSYQSESVRVVRQPNAGAAVARNTGLALANGELIQFLDAGDLLSTDKIEKQVTALRANPLKLAVCSYVQFTSADQLNSPSYPDQSSYIYSTDDPLDFLVNLWGGNGEMNFIQTNSWLVPREIINRAGIWRNYRCPDDDGEFFARAILASEGIEFVPGVYNYYHISPGANQLSTNKNRKYLQNTLLTIDLKHGYLLKKGKHPLISKAMASQYLRFAVYQYPAQKTLSLIAYSRFQSFHEKVPIPNLGGKGIELVKQIFGWRMARLIRYYFRE